MNKVSIALLITILISGGASQATSGQIKVGAILNSLERGSQLSRMNRLWENPGSSRFLYLNGFPLFDLAQASDETRKFLEYGADEANCETEMAHLDNYSIELQRNPSLRAYVIAYGGSRGTARREMKARRARIHRYLVKERGIDSRRVLIIDGGFRNRLSIELWLVPESKELPKARPTISARRVNFQRSKYSFDCSTFY
ncbi:MAG TPA: hypothetical protein VE732_00275 [Nitrososphaera sp.]|jgi:hypothetical protein|nr:hypothetical protein [Nitrososphaera sp.]